MKLTNLKINGVQEPLGWDCEQLTASWQVEDPGQAVRARRVRVTVRDGEQLCLDTGWQEQASCLDFPLDFAPRPRTRYDWKVQLEADDGTTAAGESWFESGKRAEPWAGQWISSPFDSDTPPCFCRHFSVAGSPQKARLYLAALGVYEVYLNGRKVGGDYLAPGYTDFKAHVPVCTYDLDGLVQQGVNLLCIWLGNGWFKGRLGFHGGRRNLYGNQFYALGELRIQTDEGEIVLGTDDSWTAVRSPVRFSEIYDGEQLDLTADPGKPEACLLRAPEGLGPLRDRFALPVTEKERLPVQQMISTPKGEVVLDFGQNLTGWVEIAAPLPRGTVIRLQAGEILQQGCFYRDNLRQAKAEFTAVADGTGQVMRPHFTFFGFRYMKVECSLPVEASWFCAVHVRSDFPRTGWVETDHPKVNQLLSNALWSQKDNFLDVPTDCPQRDERLGWTGDAQVFSETACYQMDCQVFFAKYLRDMRVAQLRHQGAVPNVIPEFEDAMLGHSGICPWSDAAAIIPWNLYLFYGSKTLLQEQYPMIRDWVEYQYRRERARGGLHLITEGFHFADWLALDHPDPGPIGATDPLMIASAYYYRCTCIVADAAAALGYQEDEKKYRALAELILADLRKTYYTPEGACRIRTQTALALSIAFEISPRPASQDAADLADLIRENGGKLNTGFTGTPLLCGALTRGGQFRTALSLLLNEEYPGWLYCVNLGATTIWERWNSVLPDGTMNSEGMNSLNHYAYGSIAAWIYRDLCGLRPVKEAPGFSVALAAPHFCKELAPVECTLDTAAGRWRCGWKAEPNGEYSYHLEVPFGASARLKLPGQEEQTLATGRYTFRVAVPEEG